MTQHYTCTLCNTRFVLPDKQHAVTTVGHLYGFHRCAAVKFNGPDRGKRCTLVAPHQHRHHVYDKS